MGAYTREVRVFREQLELHVSIARAGGIWLVLCRGVSRPRDSREVRLTTECLDYVFNVELSKLHTAWLMPQCYVHL